MKNKKQRLKTIGATAIILVSGMATEAGKVSMNLNCSPQGDYNMNRTGAASEPTISVNVEQPKLSNIPQQSERYEDTAISLQQKKLRIINANRGVLGHLFASVGDDIRQGKAEDAVLQIDRTLERLHDYPSLSGNETRDVDTQTTLSMLSESNVSVQTEAQVKEAGVQVSSSMASASAQTDSVPISSTFAQT